MRVLVVNAGSSSLKLSVLDGDELVWSGSELDEIDTVDAVGHRIVHGGTEFVEPVLIDAEVVRRLEALTDLAPLHQPKSLRALALVSRELPDVPAVACFDTAFHARMPATATTYALPREWRTRWDLRKFGFHGLSHEYASARALELAGAPAATRVVTCHLGAGASLAAVRDGHSVDTTMGFTPLDGLVMATRSGEVDPGLILWLEEHMGMPPSELASTLEHRSGLLGLTGTADMKTILEREAAGDEQAALAVGIYLHRLRGGIAAMTAALGGLDVLVFTGGVGERSAPVRARAAEGLEFLGVGIDPARNDSPQLDAEVGADGAAVRSFAVAAREDLQIARGVRAVLG
ncbi:MAG TPA: acetate/propionate family kinase [Gaiellaceae bacterium]|nr:acetate/propionate family kinase [Gaiellaceae bacterium]